MSKARRSSYSAAEKTSLIDTIQQFQRQSAGLMASLPINGQGYNIAQNAHEAVFVLLTWLDVSEAAKRSAAPSTPPFTSK